MMKANQYPQSEVMEITPAVAQEWLEKYRYRGQRQVRDSHVEFLANEMLAGRFRLSTIRLMHKNGATAITDGQHRLWAAFSSGSTIVVNVLHMFTDRDEEIADDYTIGGMAGLARTNSDIVRAYEVGLATDKRTSVAIAAFRVLAHGFEPLSDNYLTRSPDSKRKFLVEWKDYAEQYFDAIGAADTKRRPLFNRSMVTAVGMVTFRYQPEKAREFWEAVAKDDGLKAGDPCRALLHYLLDNIVTARSVPYHTRAIAQCWNNAFTGGDLQYARVLESMIVRPIVLKGTPYDGKTVVRLVY